MGDCFYVALGRSYPLRCLYISSRWMEVFPMKRLLATLSLLLVLMPLSAFSQSSSAMVSGTVSDATSAVLPGVSMTATNTATGVVTTVISNEAGAYTFVSLLPGGYTVAAELPGFQKQTYTTVQLGNAQQVRLNFTLLVANQAQSVEVTIEADTLIATSSSSVGEVLSESKIRDLGIVGNNVLDLINVLPGFRAQSPDGVFG